VDPGAAEIVVVARGADDPDLVARAYDTVLSRSFGRDEIPPRDQFLLDVAGSTVLVALVDGDVAAAAVSEGGGRDPIGLLSHLAVRPGTRGGGVGGQMMAALQAHWSSGPPVVLGEVHDPRAWADGPDELPAARLRFYERHGARLLGVPWVQPKLWSGGDRVADMLLLVMGGSAAPDGVAAESLRSWMTAYYELTEGSDASDPTLAALLERVAAEDPVPIRPISALAAVPRLGR